MTRAALLAAAVIGALFAPVEAVDPKQRTDTGQFTIYCDDAGLRQQVASFATQTKDQVLALLGETDSWRRPIVVTLQSASSPNQPLAALRVVDSAVGMKIEIVVHLHPEPGDVNLQKYLIRAVLLEYIYRHAGVAGNTAYAEPPWWVVEGAMQLFRRREAGLDSDFFRKLVATNKLPPVETFLAERPGELGPTALAMDGALAMCLVQLLVDQPSGRAQLAGFLRNWPKAGGDSVAALSRTFPAFEGGAPAIQKWWVLNLARFASADRFEGLSAEETDRQIGALLEFEIKNEKSGATRRFAVREFAEYLKLRECRAVLATHHAALVALSTRANPLLRPVLAEYEAAFALLQRGKSRGVRERLEKADTLRAAVVRRIAEIGDYLNWFEATQISGSSGAFDNYLRTANELSEKDRQNRDPVARYLDNLEQQY